MTDRQECLDERCAINHDHYVGPGCPTRKPYTAPTIRTVGPWESLGPKRFDALCSLRNIRSK